MSNSDTALHVRGISRYVDDCDFPDKGLDCVIYFSPIAKGKILSLKLDAARNVPGVEFILTADDIPGANELGGLVQDEPLLADGEVDFVGMPVAAVYAWHEDAARDAVALIEAEYEEESPILDPREAFEKDELIVPLRTFIIGDAEQAIANAPIVVSGTAASGGQEHFYLEGQACIAFPSEGGGVYLSSSTQGPTAVQRTVSRICDLPMHQVEVDVRRLGGGFGGKEDQANTWASFAALGAQKGGVPCRMVLRRWEDMLGSGGRNPYSSDFTLAMDQEGRFLGYKAMFYQDSGAAADLSPAILERTLFHCTASYYVPHVHATAASCRTNVVPNTAFRGFGGPQGMFVFESAIREASRVSGIPVQELQRKNLLRDGQILPYGQVVEEARAEACWDKAFDTYPIQKRMEKLDALLENEKKGGKPARYARGYAMMPVCFGISFTSTFLNQARALVHVYTDGTVGVSTAAVEMGQGVNQKIRHVVADSFGVSIENIKLETTNTTRVANTSPTAASSGSDLNGAAAELACEMILERLLAMKAADLGCDAGELKFNAGHLYRNDSYCEIDWPEVVNQAYMSRVHLSAEAHYATPDIHFDKSTEKGRPFAYHAYGSAYIEAEVDRLLGTYVVDKAWVVHDLGRSINEIVDLGQVEGGLAQGVGWMTVEEMRFNEKGVPLTSTAGTYKLPDINSAPQDMKVEFLEDAYNKRAVRGSKAVGEPPLMYGIGAYFAIQMAAGVEQPLYDAPITPEKLFSEIRSQQEADTHKADDGGSGQ